MKILLYNLLRKFLSQESRNNLKALLFKFKIRNKRFFHLIYGTVSDENLMNHIMRKLGADYDILMIHSSLNDMLPMYTGNLNALLDKLINFCNINNITLVMPAFFFGTENISIEEYYKDNIFDLKLTPSQMGILTELFRRKPGVKRSIHPTHSVCACGPLADLITKEHHLARNTTGRGSPFAYMAKYKTKILGLGTKYYRTLTQIHATEGLMEDEFPLIFDKDNFIPVKCKIDNEKIITYRLTIDSHNYLIDRILLRRILREAKIDEWRFNGIPMYLTEAKIITETMIESAKNGKIIFVLK